MDAEIHAVDTERPASEGQRLDVHGARITFTIKRHPGLPLGEPRDQFYIELTGEGWDKLVRSTITATFSSDELQALFDKALEVGLVTPPPKRRVVELIEELRTELGLPPAKGQAK